MQLSTCLHFFSEQESENQHGVTAVCSFVSICPYSHWFQVIHWIINATKDQQRQPWKKNKTQQTHYISHRYIIHRDKKHPLGLAEGEREGERKKWCGLMTRWTPGARWTTPGLLGLGTLQGPHYTVCVHICPPLDTSITHTHTTPL